MKNPKSSKAIQIVHEIQNLLGELEINLSANIRGRDENVLKKRDLNYSGASGGIKMLVEEGYFKETRSLAEIVVQLRQEGFNYPRNTISMALLRGVRSRILVRLPAEGRKGKEKWVYVIRK